MQSALDALTHRYFENDPLPVNVILLAVALVVGVALVRYVTRKSRTLHKELLEEEARRAQETEQLMPGADVQGMEEDRRRGERDYGTLNGNADERSR